jgi:hypothetical protein
MDLLRTAQRFLLVLLAGAAVSSVSRAQDAGTMTPLAEPPAYIPLNMRWGYYPLYSPVYYRAYFAAWAQANQQAAAAVAPRPFYDPRTTVGNAGYAAYYYSTYYYTPGYLRYSWYYPSAYTPAIRALPMNYVAPTRQAPGK